MKREPADEGPAPPNPKRFVSAPKLLRLSKVPSNLNYVPPPKQAPPPPPPPSSSSSSSSSSSTSSSSSSSRGEEADPRVRRACELRSRLNADQLAAADCALAGSTFVTGPAGSGKSALLRYLVAELRVRHPSPGAVAVTASTGCAAVSLGGTTLHQWAGVGRCQGSAQTVLAVARNNRRAIRNWQSCRVLLVDEISMISAEVFSAVSQVGAAMRGAPGRPFGGLHVIVCGDFHQLAPVKAEHYCFETPEWRALFGHRAAVLETVMRQRDEEFVRLLAKIRTGDVSELELLNRRCCRPLGPSQGGVVASKLFCTNVAVDAINKEELAKLGAGGASRDVHTLRSVDWHDDEGGEKLLKSFPVGEEVSLKVGAQVVLLANVAPERGLVNGSRGVVVAFGVDMSDENSAWMRRNMQCVPMVKFTSGTVVAMMPREFSCEGASRVQVPLSLCWAVTVHKAQGMTLDRCALDLSEAFAVGQAYTALSRVRGMDCLELMKPLKPSNIKTSKVVLEFYRSLNT